MSISRRDLGSLGPLCALEVFCPLCFFALFCCLLIIDHSCPDGLVDVACPVFSFQAQMVPTSGIVFLPIL